MKKAFLLLAVAIAIVFLIYAGGRYQALTNGVSLQQDLSDKEIPSTSRLKFATYNIAHGRGSELGFSNWDINQTEMEDRLVSIGHFFHDKDIDIALLNEVDFDASWSGGIDQAGIIASSAGFPFIARQINYDLSLPGFSLTFGNAILSRYPIIEAERIALPPMSKLEAVFFGNHDALRIVVDTGESPIEVWGLHLEVRSESARIAAVEHLGTLFNEMRPKVVLGDLNSQPEHIFGDRTALGILSQEGRLRTFPDYQEPMATFPAREADRTLDWILYDDNLRRIDAEVIDLLYSDHLPVVVTFEL